jgi:DNA modification methylase
MGMLCSISDIMAKTDWKKKFLNKIICGSAVDVMREIPKCSVDLVITSPPYNLKNSTGNGMKDGRGGKWANAALQNGRANYDTVEICNHCGESVSFGSGKFVNRIPDLNDILTRIDNGLLFSVGDFVCAECDDSPLT